MSMNFEQFDKEIGTDGYFQYFRELLFPHSTNTSINVSTFSLNANIYPEGTAFTRVRKIDNEERRAYFLSDGISVNEFYSPKLNSKPGRFNQEGDGVIYLADSLETAIHECDLKVGDFLLYSNLTLKKNMRFIVPGDSENPSLFNEELTNLLNTKDKDFYPLITDIYKKFLQFNDISGVVYHSTRLRKHEFSEEKSDLNIAIDGIQREDVGFLGGMLLYLADRCEATGDYCTEMCAIYQLSPDTDKLTVTRYHDDNELFIRKIKDYEELTKINAIKCKEKTENEDFSEFGNFIFKMTERKE
ncbi:RES family NAD+ phosphorylase [Cedecea lapagei]|uniref:RES family NAD+ phosphorylase n=1 Tax=Cedecea lapagei TaxID=158823 RepID=UPI001BCF4B80|nr:RES family NAD+ phosphorylase [Cedecea lapagei]